MVADVLMELSLDLVSSTCTMADAVLTHLESCRTKDDCLFMVLVEALQGRGYKLFKSDADQGATTQMGAWHVVGLHQRRFAASEHSLHRVEQVSGAVRAAAAGSSRFALVDLKALQPHA